MEFQGKVALVTGGATGIGKTAAMMFAARGAKVVIATARNVAGGEAAVKEIEAAGGEAMFLQMDASKEEDVRKAIGTIVEKYGRLDFAFNNAGQGPDGVRIPFKPLTELDEEYWDRVVDTNMKGTFLCMKYEIRQMIAQGGGAVVNTTSSGGLSMKPNFGAYGPSKAGVIALTKLAAIENAKLGVRVNSVCPGPTAGTVLMDNNLATNPNEEQILKERVIPMGKLGTTEDIAKTVMWLCSEESSHITGVNISVDGGVHLN